MTQARQEERRSKGRRSPSKGKRKMASFKYVGDPNDKFSGPEATEQYGLKWVKGEVVNVPEDTPEGQERVGRLRKNSHFVDMSDKEEAKEVAERQKALDQAEASKRKQEEEQQKRDEADRKQMMENQKKALRKGDEVTAATAPRPPGTVTREPVQTAFQGRTVEERTQAEDHTKSGKTKS